ncbi:MAG: glycosyltransferase family 2 protein [Deltaproteobacteria bacterium]|nr:glycosyltransferase family 2 protein [Deltaproteobacteria bacterium]
MLVSIVLSFRNEEDNIPELVRRLHCSLGSLKPLGIEYELIFVNDASTDGSLELLNALKAGDSTIKIINMSRRFGSTPCVIAGMERSSGDAVVYMDTDLQDPPELIPELVKRWLEGADVVYTTRLTRDGESRFKMWLTRRAYRTIKFFSDVDIPVDSGDFKLLDRRVVKELLRLKEKDPYMRGLISWVGFRHAQVFYDREKRFAGRTHYPLFGLGPLRAFVSGLASFSTAPLSLALVIGFLVSIGAFFFLIDIVIEKFMGRNLPGWSAIMATMLFLGGTELFTIGILGIYVGRIYNENKRRPNYIIESTSGFEEARPAGKRYRVYGQAGKGTVKDLNG